jgi:TIR domain
LHARGDVRSVAKHLAGGIDDDGSAVQSDAGGELWQFATRIRCVQVHERAKDRQSGAGRAFGIVLLSPRISEQRHESVAQPLGDMTAVLGDRLGGVIEISANEIAPVLGVECSRQTRRADQIAEHDRDRPALGFVSRAREAGLKAFLDRYGLPAGQPWQPWLEQRLASCGTLVVLVGPLGFGEWQNREIQLGLDRQASVSRAGKAFPVIPVLLPGVANDAVPVGRFLSLNTWVDLRAGLDAPESLQRLISGAQGKAIDTAAAEARRAGLTPYRGLLPFREEDAGLCISQ